MKKGKYLSILVIGLCLMLIVILAARTGEPIDKPLKKGDIIKATIVKISGDNMDVELMGTDEQIKLIIDDESVLYTYNGTSNKHKLNNWDVLEKGVKVEVRLRESVKSQEECTYYVDRIGILHTWFY